MKNTMLCSYKVNSFDVDPTGYARLTSIANFLQETAYRHANSLELGYHHLAERNMAWILSRMRIKMKSYPRWDDTIEIETWPHGIDKLFALRDFRIRDSTGKVLGEAMTCWLMADLTTHRPQRINPDFIKVETRSDSVFTKSVDKIPLPENLEAIQQRKVLPSDLDIVEHVNNVKYIEWCMDSLYEADMDGKCVKDISLNYLSETRKAEEVSLLVVENGEDFVFSAQNQTKARECFRAKIQIGSIASA